MPNDQMPGQRDAASSLAGAVLGFVFLAAIGRPHLADEIPMRVPWVVVFNLFPLVAALAVIALPTHLFGNGPGYFVNSLLATAVYVLCLAILIRVRGRLLLG